MTRRRIIGAAVTGLILILVSLQAGGGWLQAVPAHTEAGKEEDAFSPLFEKRLELGKLHFDPEPDRIFRVAYQRQSQPVEIISGGVSLCLTSGCLGSLCLGSACIISNCIGSACSNSKCVGSLCGTSLCAGSVCAGSACGGSVCAGSACAGSVCAGCRSQQLRDPEERS